MSNIYIQEPPTNGKILLQTTVGDLELELWSKEAPKTCRQFVQLCLDRKYNKTIFHRLVKDFIVQCGESTEKITKEPVKNEFHSRLRFSRRGLVAMAQNDGIDSNIEFFFTLDATPELQNKHTIFAKVSGETIYNLLKLNESQTDANDRPLYPHKINKVKILHNPFDDIVPSIDFPKKSENYSTKQKKVNEGVKNFKLISFGDEAEQDEQEMESLPKETEKEKERQTLEPSNSKASTSSNRQIRENQPKPEENKDSTEKLQNEDSSDSDYELTLKKEKLSELERKKREIQDQIKDVKKQYQKDRKEKNQPKESEPSQPDEQHENLVIRGYLDEKEKYKQKKLPAKGKSREDFTLSLLAKFKSKLHSALDIQETETEQAGENSEDDNWLSHKLDFSESEAAVLAKDASKKQDDWYDIYDPRNPINKRKRGEEKSLPGESIKKKK